MNTPHPDLETLAELADRDIPPASDAAAAADPTAADPTAADPAADVLAHVAGCAACTADLQALRRVRETLRALPPVPMPADVAERIEAALLAARASAVPLSAAPVSGPLAAAVTAPETVVPLRSRSTTTRRSTASRWRTLPYGAVASIVIVLALIVVGIVAIGHSSNDSKKSASTAAAAATSSAPTSATIESGTNYTTADLRAQVATVVSSAVPGAAANFPGLTYSVAQPAAGSAAATSAAAAPSAPAAAPAASFPAAAASSPALPPVHAASPFAGAAGGGTADSAAGTAPRALAAPAGPLADPAALARCVEILAGKAEQPLLVDYATFNGVPSTIIVLPDPDVAQKLDIYVEADTANCANKEFTFETFLGPSPAP